jgi:hypothetical protein
VSRHPHSPLRRTENEAEKVRDEVLGPLYRQLTEVDGMDEELAMEFARAAYYAGYEQAVLARQEDDG